MRRLSIPTVGALFTVVLLLGGCSAAEKAAKGAAEEAVGKLQCAALQLVTDKLPQGDQLDEAAIGKVSDAARGLKDVVAKVPADKLPAGAKDKVDQALDQAADAAGKYKSDPEAAKAAARTALDGIRSVAGSIRSALGC